MFSRLLPGCLTPTCRQRRHNYICQATCPGCPLFPCCPAAQCSLFSRLLPSRLFTRHYPLGREQEKQHEEQKQDETQEEKEEEEQKLGERLRGG